MEKEVSRESRSGGRFFALIPAAGVGRRMGLDVPKQYMELGGRTMLERTVCAVARSEELSGIAVVCSPDDGWIGSVPLPEGTAVLRCGGDTRAETVRNGVNALLSGDAPFSADSGDWILVHDAARPFVQKEDIDRLIKKVRATGRGAVLAMPMSDTVKEIDSDGVILSTPDRSKLCRAATPQAFRAGTLKQALSDDLSGITDESSAAERMGLEVGVVFGSALNFKVTAPSDAELAQAVSMERDAREMTVRVGQGWDIHRIEEGRKLFLGGVEIPGAFGLAGHSDADVLLHAVTDAVLGAAGLGDIGDHFPPSDMKWKGADSAVLLKTVLEEVHEAGWNLVNLDCTVITESPKLYPWKRAIRERLAELTELPAESVNFKAKTKEKLDSVGAGRAMEAQAVVLIRK